MTVPGSLADRLRQPITRFMRIESASAFLLFGAALAALVWANSPWSHHYRSLLEVETGLTIGAFDLEMTLHELVNDGLMTIFFFVVGLEIKRELAVGDLRDPRAAVLPVAAALGGMVVPAVIYLALEGGKPASAGWGIPIATDIAFAVGIITLMGRWIPHTIKIFVLTAAIVDDIGAIAVIAIFYSADVLLAPLGLAAAGFAIVILMQRSGVSAAPLYFLVGAVIWYGFLKSGIHPTIAGVIAALLTPISEPVPLWQKLRRAAAFLPAKWVQTVIPRNRYREARLNTEAAEAGRSVASSPLVRLNSALHPWSAFVIMPVFALMNAGVMVSQGFLEDRESLAIGGAVAMGLVLGKPAGVLIFGAVAVKTRLARLPANVPWSIFVAAAVLMGIGFTVSLFIAELAFTEQNFVDAAKVGVLVGSAIAAIVGLLLIAVSPKQRVTESGGGAFPSHPSYVA